MRRILDKMPLFRSIRALSPRSDRGATALYFAAFVAASISIAVPFSEALTSQYIACHHFRPKSWPAWGVIQLLPKMYSFAHTCWIGTSPLDIEGGDPAALVRFDRASFWVNHYPARRARFDGGRGELGVGSTRYIYVRSAYFGHAEITGFRIHVEPDRMTFERTDEAP